MPESSTRIRDLPHFRVAATDLAIWIENHGGDSWWSVDGDPLLTEQLDFPCPGEDLAAELRRLGKPLLLLDAQEAPTAVGEMISADQLDRVAFIDYSGNRVFQFSWEGGPDVDWLLVEDTETSERSLGLDSDEDA